MGKLRKEVDGATKARNPKNKRNKTSIMFDEKTRNDWLTGFSRRKNERRKRAQHEEIERLREEKRQVKKQKREERAKELEDMRKAVGANFPTEMDSVAEPQVYDLPSHTVTVVDVLDPNFSGRSGLRLGINDDDDEEENVANHEDKANVPPVEEGGVAAKKGKTFCKSQSHMKKAKKHGKSRKNLSHLMDKRRKKKKEQVPNKWTRFRHKK